MKRVNCVGRISNDDATKQEDILQGLSENDTIDSIHLKVKMIIF